VAGIVAIGFSIFIFLAQAQVIFVPYFTPTYIEFEGLQEQYPINGSMTYVISLMGFGSNCIAFKMEMLREDTITGGEERIAYFNKIDDCRTIQISQGPYNYSRDFSYSGSVLGKPGDYRVYVNVFDEITRQNATDNRPFKIVE
jgi:hypothetical protein